MLWLISFRLHSEKMGNTSTTAASKNCTGKTNNTALARFEPETSWPSAVLAPAESHSVTLYSCIPAFISSYLRQLVVPRIRSGVTATICCYMPPSVEMGRALSFCLYSETMFKKIAPRVLLTRRLSGPYWEPSQKLCSQTSWSWYIFLV